MTYRGFVQKGERRGKELGYPTANIPLTDSEPSGIYAAWTSLGGKKYASAVFADQTRKLLETHMLDFDGEDFYGHEIEVELVKKLRDTMRFAYDEELRAAITADIHKVREILL